jgi:hypothetical protein
MDLIYFQLWMDKILIFLISYNILLLLDVFTLHMVMITIPACEMIHRAIRQNNENHIL